MRNDGGRGPVGIFHADEQVFRFYRDATVLGVLIRPAPGAPDGPLIASWLRREDPSPGVHVTRYELRGTSIAFTTRNHLRPPVPEEAVLVHGTWSLGALPLALTGRGWRVAPRRFVRLRPRR